MEEQNQQQPTPQPEKPKKKIYKKWWFWVFIVLIIIMLWLLWVWFDLEIDSGTNFPASPTPLERIKAKKLPKEQCGCWDGINEICLPSADCI